ncbi:MAG: prepilin-type N-terminal cleavage/methylation domain-containing protein [Candidatus Omnitrophica bacterium]|nr:prepilin-type N-terminal cleavage/methylation domain-containing protein [Candidatus Omnitrophota bacterium]
MKKKGFTLTEVVITIVILGVLASIGIPSFQNVIKDTRIKDASTNLLILYTAQRIYHNENGSYVSANGAAALNTALNTGIIPGDTLYTCDSASEECRASGTGFGLRIDIAAATPVVN